MPPSELMNVSELATYLRLHPTTVTGLAKRGKLPAFRVGNSWRFEKEAIDDWRRKQEEDLG
jgi:excisionase family DNA binding protein